MLQEKNKIFVRRKVLNVRKNHQRHWQIAFCIKQYNV